MFDGVVVFIYARSNFVACQKSMGLVYANSAQFRLLYQFHYEHVVESVDVERYVHAVIGIWNDWYLELLLKRCLGKY